MRERAVSDRWPLRPPDFISRVTLKVMHGRKLKRGEDLCHRVIDATKHMHGPNGLNRVQIILNLKYTYFQNY